MQRIHERELEQNRRSIVYAVGLTVVMIVVVAAVTFATIIVAQLVGH